MKKICDGATGEPLAWRQSAALKLIYDLYSGEETIATLTFHSTTGSLAIGQSLDGAWSFKRIGCFDAAITVRPHGQENNLAVYKNKTWSSGGQLTLVDGRCYQVVSHGWETCFEIMNRDGAPLIRFSAHSSMQLSAVVTVTPDAAHLAELPWLIMLGGYLAVMFDMDATELLAVSALMATIV
jgi:hypothetical protein